MSTQQPRTTWSQRWLRPILTNVVVAALAILVTAYITSDETQRAARYYDPARDESYIRALSFVTRLAGEYNPSVVFIALHVAGVLLIVILLVILPPLLHWLGLHRLARMVQ